MTTKEHFYTLFSQCPIFFSSIEKVLDNWRIVWTNNEVTCPLITNLEIVKLINKLVQHYRHTDSHAKGVLQSTLSKAAKHKAQCQQTLNTISTNDTEQAFFY